MAFNPKHIILSLSLLAGACACASSVPAFRAQKADVTVSDKTGTLSLLLDLDLREFRLGRNAEVVYTPVIISRDGTRSLELNPFVICGRNRYYWYLRNGGLQTALGPVYRAGSRQTLRVNESTDIQPWMLEGGTVEVVQREASCCAAPRKVDGGSEWGNVAVARLRPVTNAFESEFDYVFAPPVAQEPVKKSIEGKAFVTFVVNRTELNPDYMDNPKELKKITGSIDLVKADPDAIITEVHIRGYASPEGPYDNNVRLAQGRTETLAAYVNSLYKFMPGIMTTSYDPEDWGGLRSYVADSMAYDLTDRKGLLEVIDSPLLPDARDAALKKQFPKDYQVILKEIYPWLRHSDYTVKYNIKVYTDLADLMRLYNSDPTKLRAVDFYTIAQQYTPGSAQYNDVMRKAVMVYPDDPMLNLNMANIYLESDNLPEAQRSLQRVGSSPIADYARGILAAKKGDYDEAALWFRVATDAGIGQAAEYLRQIHEEQTANQVEMILGR